MCSFPSNYSLHDSSHSRQSLASLDNIVVVSVCFPHQECSYPPPQLESSLSCNSSPHSPLRRELVPPAVSVLIRGIKIMANWTPKSQYQDFMPLMCMWKFERNSYFAKCPFDRNIPIYCLCKICNPDGDGRAAVELCLLLARTVQWVLDLKSAGRRQHHIHSDKIHCTIEKSGETPMCTENALWLI